MKKFWVYVHTCPNGKKYVGCTTQDPLRRWNEGKGYINQVFGRAILKFGWDNITHEVLEVESEEEMYRKEIELISFFHSNDPKFGYNQTEGGDRPPVSDRTKEKLSEALKGRVLSEETRKKISESNKGKPKPHSEEWKTKVSSALRGRSGNFRGKRHSEETRKKMSLSQKGLTKACKGKPKPLYAYRFPDNHIEKMTATKACRSYIKKGISLVKLVDE